MPSFERMRSKYSLKLANLHTNFPWEVPWDTQEQIITLNVLSFKYRYKESISDSNVQFSVFSFESFRAEKLKNVSQSVFVAMFIQSLPNKCLWTSTYLERLKKNLERFRKPTSILAYSFSVTL